MFPAFPPTPGGAGSIVHPSQLQHHQQNGYPINGSGESVGGGGGDHPTPLASQAPNTLERDASYFPQVSQKLEEEVEEEGARIETSSEPPQIVGEGEGEGRPRISGHSASDTALAGEMAQRLNLKDEDVGGEGNFENGTKKNLHHRRSSSVVAVGGVIAQPGWAEEEVDLNEGGDQYVVMGGRGEPDEEEEEGGGRNLKQERRRSFVPPPVPTSDSPPSTSTAASGVGKTVGGSPGKLKVGESHGGVRRASFEDSTRQRPAFGTSIWG